MTSKIDQGEIICTLREFLSHQTKLGRNRVIKKRTELMPKLKEARRKNQRAFLRFDKLVIYDNPVNSGCTNDERASGESSNAD